ncbi:MAG: DUF5677 domain-containing protein [Bryobacteraceae bacterium]
MNDEIGFTEFHKDAVKKLGPLLTAARSFFQIGRAMMNATASGQLQDIAKQITQIVANSMESVVFLVCNGCGLDALRIARTMFESAVTLHYIDSHPELVKDYVDFQWVIQKKHYDYRRQLPADKVKPIGIAPEKVAEMLARYKQVAGRFTDKKGRIRNSWCKTNLKDMAKEVGGESMYGAIYPFGSSMTHTDILAVIAGAYETGGDVKPVPSEANLPLALQIAVTSYAMMLTALDKIANLGQGDSIEAAFTQFKNAS